MTKFLLSSLLFASFLQATTVSSLMPVNGPGTFPYLGFVVGPANTNDDLAAGSFNYALLTLASFTAPGVGPSASGNAYSGQNDETSVFSIDGSNNLTAQWVNTNLSLPTTTLVYLAGSDGLLITGDFTAFNAAFPGGTQVRFTYIPSDATTGVIQIFNSSNNASLGYVADFYTNSATPRFGLASNLANALVIDNPNVLATPEPESAWLLTSGLGLLWVARRRSA